MSELIPIHVRLDPDQKRELEAWAREERVPMAVWIRHILTKALKERGAGV